MRIAGIYKTNRAGDNFVERGATPEVVDAKDWPLGLQIILAIAKQEGHEVDLFLPKRADDNQEVLDFNPDLALYSSTSCKYPFTLDFHRKLKKQKPGLLSGIGGYHATAFPEVVEDGFDVGVQGEGEETFRELLRAIVEKKDFAGIRGVSFMENGSLVANPRRPRMKNLDDVPEPFINDRLMAQKSNYLYYPPQRLRRGIYAEYSRGCLGNCSFCASESMFGRRIVSRDAEKTADYFDRQNKENGINEIFLTDLNLSQDYKALDGLVSALIKRKLGERVSWGFMSGFDIKTDMARLAESGCNFICWGIENVNSQGWMAAQTRKLPTLDRMTEVLAEAEKNEIMNEGFYMIGWPEETKRDLENAKEVLPRLPLHMIRPSIYTPLPGSEVYLQMKQQGVQMDSDFSKYDCQHLVFEHPGFKPGELEREQLDFLREFYSHPVYHSRVERFTKAFLKYRECFDEFLELIKKSLFS